MAADITNQATPVFQDGECFKTALFAVKNASAGDTIDLANYFRVVKRAGLVSATGTAIAGVTITQNSTQMLTLATIPTATPAITQDAVWIIAVGVAV
jgi:hypothetical protein